MRQHCLLVDKSAHRRNASLGPTVARSPIRLLLLSRGNAGSHSSSAGRSSPVVGPLEKGRPSIAGPLAHTMNQPSSRLHRARFSLPVEFQQRLDRSAAGHAVSSAARGQQHGATHQDKAVPIYSSGGMRPSTTPAITGRQLDIRSAASSPVGHRVTDGATDASCRPQSNHIMPLSSSSTINNALPRVTTATSGLDGAASPQSSLPSPRGLKRAAGGKSSFNDRSSYRPVTNFGIQASAPPEAHHPSWPCCSHHCGVSAPSLSSLSDHV